MISNIYYWKGASGNQTLIDDHADTIHKLLTDSHALKNLEKLAGPYSPPIYSYRLNKKGRLLFTTLNINGQHCLHLLEHLPEHEYSKSAYLKHGVLKRELNKNGDTLHAIQPDYQPVSEQEIPAFSPVGENPQYQFIALDYFNQQFIQLNPTQGEALRARFPMIINGVAGSGKSYVSLSILSETIATKGQVNITNGTNDIRLLYVSKERRLVTAMKTIWDELMSGQPVSEYEKVEFKTYNELVHPGILVQNTLVDQAYFKTWNKIRDKSSTHLDSAKLYQDFRICSGFSLDDYCKLGKRQCSVPVENRGAVYIIYQSYLEYLTSHNKIDPAFQAPPVHEPVYDVIVADESQNLSLLQQRHLSCLARNQTIAYCIDPHQNLVDACATRPLLEAFFWYEGNTRKISTITLNKTFRCPSTIAKVADMIVGMKYHITGGKIDKEEVTSFVTDDSLDSSGHVVLINSAELPNYAHILKRAEGNHFAVVTHHDLIDEAKQRFQTPLVFTPDSIQGLEYHTVMTYKLLSDDESNNIFKNIYTSLINISPDNNQTTHRAKEGEEDNQYAPWFNRIYTACTRASNTLIICEDPHRHSAVFFNLIRNRIPNETAPDAILNEPQPEINWQREAIDQYHHGNRGMTINICKNKLHMTDTDISSFLVELHSNQTQPRASQQEPARANTIVVVTAAPPSQPDSTTHAASTITIERKNKPSPTKKNAPSERSQRSPDEIRLTDLVDKDAFDQLNTIMDDANVITLLFNTRIKATKEYTSLYQCITKSDARIELFCMAIRRWWEVDPSSPAFRSIIKTFTDKIISNKDTPALISETLFSLLALVMPRLLEETGTWRLSINKKNALSLYTNEQMCYLIQKFIDSKRKKIFSATELGEAFGLTQNKIAKFPHLFYLTASEDGHELLKKLLSNYPAVINAVPAASWAWAPTSWEDEALSPLFWLSGTKTGRPSLEILLDKYRSIVEAIPYNAWVLAPTQGAYKNISPLLNIALFANKSTMLKTLLNSYPSIIANLPPITFAHAYDKNVSILSRLADTQDGRRLLLVFCNKHPSFIAGIPPVAWILAPEEGPDKNKSPLFLLSESPDGRQILKALLDKYPDVIRIMPPEAWNAPAECPSFQIEYDGTIISTGDWNRTHTDMLCGPEFTVPLNLAGEKLCVAVNSLQISPTDVKGNMVLNIKAGPFPNYSVKELALNIKQLSKQHSPLFFLCKHEHECQIMLELYENNPDIFLKTTPPIEWSQVQPDAEYENDSFLYWLAKTENGRSIIRDIVKKNMPTLLEPLLSKAVVTLPSVVKEELNCYLITNTNPKTAASFVHITNQLKQIAEQGITVVWDAIKDRVATRMFDDFGSLFTNKIDERFTNLIDTGRDLALGTLPSFQRELSESMGYQHYCSSIIKSSWMFSKMVATHPVRHSERSEGSPPSGIVPT